MSDKTVWVCQLCYDDACKRTGHNGLPVFTISNWLNLDCEICNENAGKFLVEKNTLELCYNVYGR